MEIIFDNSDNRLPVGKTIYFTDPVTVNSKLLWLDSVNCNAHFVVCTADVWVIMGLAVFNSEKCVIE